jgi:trehalose synthase
MSKARTSDLWWKNAVVYCLDVETFLDTDGDGRGDFAGLTDRVDYLAGIGVTCIWLMPFYPSPNRDDGYDVTDYYGVDPRLGSHGDLVAFVRTARDRGMRIIVDLVVNHTSDRHPWFRDARSGQDSRRRDWYVWADEPPEEPTADVVFPDAEDSIWTKDERSGQWYLHHFYSHQPDLNIANPAVREEIAKIAGFWLQVGVDGFRVDAVPYLIETGGTALEEAPLDPHELLRDLRSFMARRRGDAVMLGEVNLPPEGLVEFFGDDDELQLLFDFPLMQAMYLALARRDAGPIRAALAARPEVPEDSQWAIFVRNHDELTLDQLTDDERAEVFEAFGPEEDMQLFGRGLRRRLPPMLGGDPAHVRLVYSLLFSLPGTPVLFYGEEIGMGENLEVEGRLSVRTPMQWSDGRNAGFSTARPSRLPRPLPDGQFGPLAVNVAAQRRDESSLLNWMERVIRRRRETPAFGWGTATLLDASDDAVLAHRCDWEGDVVVAVHNLDPAPREVTVDLGDPAGSDGGGSDDAGVHELVDLLEPHRPNLQVESSSVELKVAGFAHHWFRLQRSGEPGPP